SYWNQYRVFVALTLRKTFFGDLKTHAKLTGNLVNNQTNLDAGVNDMLAYANPEIGFNYQFFEKQHLHASYSFNQALPAFEYLYAGRRLSGYRSIVQGSHTFALLPSNVFTFLYQFGNWDNDCVLNSTFVYSSSNKGYTTATTVTPTYNRSTWRLASGRQFLNAGLGLNEFVNFLHSNLAF